MTKYKLLCMYNILITIVYSVVYGNKVNEECYVPQELKDEIESYLPIINQIIHAIVYGEYQNFTYNELANFVDKFGNRIAGSKNLENAVDYMLERLRKLGLENVHGENVMVPHWIRGHEFAAMVQPRYQELAILGLGGSVGTPYKNIKAEVIVVKSFDELEKLSSSVGNKIVVFNEDYISYEQTVKYRSDAAVKASRYGAVATLVRSITPFSLYSPHTGWQDYDPHFPAIPTVAITVEDAHMLHRIQERGEKIVIELKMGSSFQPPSVSRNTVSEIRGSGEPQKVVLVSGHLDSWDVGAGAMDDGGGAFISWAALAILKFLNLRAKRTLRAVLWTAEEEGLVGAYEYDKRHANETDNWVFIMESDEGTFTPHGLEYTGSQYGACMLQEVVNLLGFINATHVKKLPMVGSDINIWINKGIPGASLLNDNEKYFWYHHTNADTMDVEDPISLNLATAIWASVAFVIADISIDFPRNASLTI